MNETIRISAWLFHLTAIPITLIVLLISPIYRLQASSCSRYGSTSYCDDGTSYSQIGNTTYGSDGSTYSKIGNTTYGNDGSTYSKIGNTTYGNDGTSYSKIGNTTYGSDGTSYSTYGNTTYSSGESNAITSCPAHSSYDSLEHDCVCFGGYKKSGGSCVIEYKIDSYDTKTSIKTGRDTQALPKIGTTQNNSDGHKKSITEEYQETGERIPNLSDVYTDDEFDDDFQRRQEVIEKRKRDEEFSNGYDANGDAPGRMNWDNVSLPSPVFAKDLKQRQDDDEKLKPNNELKITENTDKTTEKESMFSWSSISRWWNSLKSNPFNLSL